MGRTLQRGAEELKVANHVPCSDGRTCNPGIREPEPGPRGSSITGERRQSDGDGFPQLGDVRLERQVLADPLGEPVERVVFTVDEDEAVGGRLADPVEQDWLVGVGGEPVHGPGLGGDGDLLAEDADLLRAVDDLAAEGADGLVADELHAGPLVPEVVPEMVEDPATGAHPTPADDDVPA